MPKMIDHNLLHACPRICDVCGKPRGHTGNKNLVHAKCSKIRQARGFKS